MFVLSNDSNRLPMSNQKLVDLLLFFISNGGEILRRRDVVEELEGDLCVETLLDRVLILVKGGAAVHD